LAVHVLSYAPTPVNFAKKKHYKGNEKRKKKSHENLAVVAELVLVLRFSLTNVNCQLGATVDSRPRFSVNPLPIAVFFEILLCLRFLRHRRHVHTLAIYASGAHFPHAATV